MRAALLILALLACAAHLASADTFIVHPSMRISSLTGEEIRAVFSGRRTLWPDGRSIIVVAPSGGPGHEALMRILGKSSSQFMSSWKKLMFSGNGTMPVLPATDAEVEAVVARTPGAIGFIAGEPGAGVAAISVSDLR